MLHGVRQLRCSACAAAAGGPVGALIGVIGYVVERRRFRNRVSLPRSAEEPDRNDASIGRGSEAAGHLQDETGEIHVPERSRAERFAPRRGDVRALVELVGRPGIGVRALELVAELVKAARAIMEERHSYARLPSEASRVLGVLLNKFPEEE